MLGGLGGSVRLEKDGEGPVFWWLRFDRRRRRFDKGAGGAFPRTAGIRNFDPFLGNGGGDQ